MNGHAAAECLEKVNSAILVSAQEASLAKFGPEKSHRRLSDRAVWS